MSAADEGAQGALADAILSILVSDPQRPGFPTDEELGCLANGVAGAFADDRISQLGLDEASLSSAYADSGSLLLGDRFGASPSEIENLLDKALACTDWRRVLAVTMERDGASAEQAACFSSETSDEGLRAQVGGLLVSTEGLLDGSGEQVGQEFVRLMSVCLDFRMLMYDSLVQGSGISEESAQCVVDNMSDELVDGYFEAISAGEEAVMAAIIAELTDIQGRCLTPEEFQMMGGFGAGDDDFAEATDFQSNECPPADGSGPTVLDFAGPQPMCLDPAKQYTAVFNTTAGQMRVALDMANTPITANNFAVLAQYHYYDDTLLFRTDPSIGIIQGGAPHTNSPSDPGPGYTIADEGSGFAYEPGQIVMARTGAPNSASAQFFFAVNENTALLNSQGTYVVFGQMDNDSLAVAEAILASHVDEPDNPLGGGPEPPVTVNSVTIEETG
ncbi:peptidylprolyl isomerase [Candidatus Poriferisocius sp.]|uniref:peptidylprolyl isomerase n=1 Tax=Candidatus Poriferisocius sp. TaxID=3101276 RepID=UPI003B02E0FF